MEEDLNDMSSQFHKQKDRLKELREKKPEPSKSDRECGMI